MELIEMELRHAIAYVNDAVVPQVRSESISAMRKVSDTLEEPGGSYGAEKSREGAAFLTCAGEAD